MSKLIMLKGLPASGKSTWAKEQVEKSGGNIKRVNKDDLRAMIDNGKWSKRNEKIVLTVRDTVVREALLNDCTIIVDDTGFSPKHTEDLKGIVDWCNSTGWTPGGEAAHKFETKFFDVDVEECIRRDAKRENPVGRSVIVSMAEKYLDYQKEPKVQYTAPAGAREAIIVDIDGTLAHGIGKTRKPYEWHKVGSDTVDEEIRDLVSRYYGDYEVILLTGRDGSCKPITESWLIQHGIDYDKLYTRAAGDNRDDRVIKKEIFDKYIRGKYDVKFVLDDRDRVVNMWRNEVGLKCLQVAEGNF